jgi:quercetin dioxygenase-like cupin family protein
MSTVSSSTGDSERLRPHPTERFSAPQQLIDLRAAAADLAREAASAPHRHRQKTLIRYGHTTVALFHFAQGATMPEHLAHGTVSIHVLEGRMTIRTTDQQQTLAAGHILVLAPDVKHDLHADEESHMLLTVHLES